MGGGELIRTLNDLGLESEIPDFIARSESAKNGLFSKPRLQPLYGHRTNVGARYLRLNRMKNSLSVFAFGWSAPTNIDCYKEICKSVSKESPVETSKDKTI